MIFSSPGRSALKPSMAITNETKFSNKNSTMKDRMSKATAQLFDDSRICRREYEEWRIWQYWLLLFLLLLLLPLEGGAGGGLGGALKGHLGSADRVAIAGLNLVGQSLNTEGDWVFDSMWWDSYSDFVSIFFRRKVFAPVINFCSPFNFIIIRSSQSCMMHYDSFSHFLLGFLLLLGFALFVKKILGCLFLTLELRMIIISLRVLFLWMFKQQFSKCIARSAETYDTAFKVY